MKLEDIQAKSQYLADNYDFKVFLVPLEDVTKLVIDSDIYDTKVLKVMFRVKK